MKLTCFARKAAVCSAKAVRDAALWSLAGVFSYLQSLADWTARAAETARLAAGSAA